jgi:dihydroorotate dehydrogenase
MKLRDIDFGPILGGSGVQGFFGEGYWFHPMYRRLFGEKYSFDDITFVAKTATLMPRKGNMLLDALYAPAKLMPDCIKAKLFRGAMLNAVGLSNPGIAMLLEALLWQRRTKPFMLSVMPVDAEGRQMDELRLTLELIAYMRDTFKVQFGVQINRSCPNQENDVCTLIDGSAKALDVGHAALPEAPLMPKYSIASAPISAMMELEQHPYCDGICVSNTLPFGWKGIDWKKAWGTTTSPLEKYGGGGLSGNPLRPLVLAWIRELREAGFTKPINGGGGIMHPDHVRDYHAEGASSVFVASAATLRPWQLRAISNTAHSLTWK